MGPMNLDQLADHTKKVIGEILPNVVKEVVEESVARALEPVKDQQSSWMTRILEGQTKEEPKKREIGSSFARVVRAIAHAKLSGMFSPEKACTILRGWGDTDLADSWEKALSAEVPSGGGWLVPIQYSQDIIELLRPSAVVRSMGPLVIQIPTGTVRIPKITAGSAATYIGENVAAPKTEPTFGQITMSFKKLAALVPISNDLLRYSSPSADGIVRDDLVRAMAAREDLAFIRGDGTSATPKGLYNWIDDGNKFNANGTPTITTVTNELGTAIQLLMAANVPLIINQFPAGGSVPAVDVRPGWLFSPRTYRYLMQLRLTNGPFAFRDEMLRGMLWGFPYRVTTQILETYTGSGGVADTEIYFGGFSYAVIGESQNLLVDVSQEAAYDDGGTVKAAFSLDQTIVRVIAEHDFALRQDKGFAVIERVTWGV